MCWKNALVIVGEAPGPFLRPGTLRVSAFGSARRRSRLNSERTSWASGAFRPDGRDGMEKLCLCESPHEWS